MQTDRAVYGLGDDVEMSYRVTNFGEEDVTFNFTSTKLSHFTVQTEGNGVQEIIWESDTDAWDDPMDFPLQPYGFSESLRKFGL